MTTVDLTKERHAMRRFLWVIGIAVCLWPLLSGGVTRDEFLVRTTQDYVGLCSTSPNDPMYAAATGFCHGYGVGAYHYYQAATAGPEAKPFICAPEPTPPRAEIVQMFLAWAREHPEYMGERPVDSLFRFLGEKFPCRR
jgi:Rap1a immunity proteins